MEKTRLTSDCLGCLLNMQFNKVPKDCSEEMKLIYRQQVCKVLSEAKPWESAPLLVKYISDIQEKLFGTAEDYTEIKHFYNAYVMEMLPKLQEETAKAEDPLLRAIQYALTGNYIDFGALKTVDRGKLEQLLSGVPDIRLEESEYQQLKKDLSEAKKLVFLTDNCGEIVFDKLLIRELQSLYPDLEITVIVRGKPVLNDATMEDAKQIGLCEEVHVIGNGTNVAGTCLEMIRGEAAEEIEAADVLLAKGQGNFETLQGCGLNIYYLFMCKCDMFAKRFRVERYSGMLVNERRKGI